MLLVLAGVLAMNLNQAFGLAFLFAAIIAIIAALAAIISLLGDTIRDQDWKTLLIIGLSIAVIVLYFGYQVTK